MHVNLYMSNMNKGHIYIYIYIHTHIPLSENICIYDHTYIHTLIYKYVHIYDIHICVNRMQVLESMWDRKIICVCLSRGMGEWVSGCV